MALRTGILSHPQTISCQSFRALSHCTASSTRPSSSSHVAGLSNSQDSSSFTQCFFNLGKERARWLISNHHTSRLVCFATQANQQAQKSAEPNGSVSTDEITQEASTSQPAASKPPGPQYSPLHMNIEEFCKRIVPTEVETRAKQQVIEMIRQCANKAFPEGRGHFKVEVFGSFANGLSTWHSDVDLVITGMFEPDRVTGCYDVKERGRVTARLRKLADQIRRFKKLDIARLAIIGRARIPIIKLKTRNNVAVDISISDGTGPQAAKYIMQQARKYPPTKALVLVLKAYLNQQRLNDVASGGLSSYSLCNMVVAHQQEELKAGHDIFDLGETLYSFFLRYGEEFSYEMEAVSIKSGGVVSKGLLPFSTDSSRFAASTGRFRGGGAGGGRGEASWKERLLVDCPLTGRDVSNGTYRIDAVRQSFFRAARQLEAAARGRSINETSINYLSALFDVQRVLKRVHTHEDPFFKVLIGGNEREAMNGGRQWREPPMGVDFMGESEDEWEDIELDVGPSASSENEDDDNSGEGGGDVLENLPSLKSGSAAAPGVEAGRNSNGKGKGSGRGRS